MELQLNIKEQYTQQQNQNLIMANEKLKIQWPNIVKNKRNKKNQWRYSHNTQQEIRKYQKLWKKIRKINVIVHLTGKTNVRQKEEYRIDGKEIILVKYSELYNTQLQSKYSKKRKKACNTIAKCRRSEENQSLINIIEIQRHAMLYHAMPQIFQIKKQKATTRIIFSFFFEQNYLNKNNKIECLHSIEKNDEIIPKIEIQIDV